jgi:hypothetical protein
MNSVRDATVGCLVLLGLAGLTAGAGLLTAGVALAGVGAQPGDLEVISAGSVVTSGPLTQTPTWKATTACPAGHRVSAQVAEITTSGTLVSRISPVQSAGLASPGFTGSLDGSVGALLKVAGISASSPGTLEWAVGCWNGASGTGTGTTPVVYEQSTFVTATSAGTYTTRSSAPSGGPTPTTRPASSATPTPTPTHSPTPKPSSSPKPKPTESRKPEPTSTVTSSPGPTSSVIPSGAPQTGAGGASPPGSGLLIALGATLLAGSAAATVLAVRRARARALPGERQPGGT